jgi:hypothetical protein
VLFRSNNGVDHPPNFNEYSALSRDLANGSRRKTKYDDYSLEELVAKLQREVVTEDDDKEFEDFAKSIGFMRPTGDEPTEEEKIIGKYLLSDFMASRDEKLGEIDDIDPEDYAELTGRAEEKRRNDEFLASIKPIDFSKTKIEAPSDWTPFYDDDEDVTFATGETKRLSMEDTPVRKFKSPILNRRELRKISSPLRHLDETRGRPEGSLGVVNRLKEDAFRSDDEKIKHFKERKQKNQSKAQLTYKDLRNRDNKERLTIDNFFDY